MDPLNAQERRAHFFRFLLLFLFAVTPVVMVTYLYGRVDHVENTFLRSHYREQQSSGASSAARGQLVKDLMDQVQLVNLSAADEKMQNLDGKMEATMNTHLKQLDDKISALNTDLSTASDSMVRKLVQAAETYRLTIQTYNDLYANASEQLKNAQADLATCRSSRSDWMKAAQDCIGRLPKDEQKLIVTPD